jgi:glutathione S-transferase
MNDLILHHYPESPFAEKIRLLLGHKQLAWRSVIIPAVMPKPDLVALTGGYRRTPVLQLGADIYCDTALIARVIDRLHPGAPIFPDASALSDLSLAQFADQHLFAAAVAYAFQPAGLASVLQGMSDQQVQALIEDRKSFRKGGNAPRLPLPDAVALLNAVLPRLQAQLADGRHFLEGAAPRISDFSVYHPLWFIERAGPLATILDPYPALRGWIGRMKAIGHGSPVPLDSAEALRIAREATPAIVAGRSRRDSDGVGVGDQVCIAATDYGVDPVNGELVDADVDAVAIRRNDPAAGDLVVHFPRLGFRLTAAGS